MEIFCDLCYDVKKQGGIIMKKLINVFDHAGDICHAMSKGILLTTRHDGVVNTMTIGWGMLGIEWGKPIFIALVRQSRFTRELLDKSMEFTVNVPRGDLDAKILGFCGTKSGRHVDKIKEMGLTLEEPTTIGAPGICELPLTLECKVLYRQDQDLSGIPSDVLEKYYPQDIDGSKPGKNRDHHIAYYAEIVDAYIIE